MAIAKILKNLLEEHKSSVEQYLNNQMRDIGGFIYSSVDIRHSGVKIAPVDTNLFPAGFNVLSDKAKNLASANMAEFIGSKYPDACNIIIFPEYHTRNKAYLDNILALQNIVKNAGYNAIIGSDNIDADTKLETASGEGITIHQLQKDDNNQLVAGGVAGDVIIVNNDLSAGSPTILADLDTPIYPPTGLGWYRRRKSEHFARYNSVVAGFCNYFNIDSWLVSTIFSRADNINFKERSGLENLAHNVDNAIARIAKKYNEYNVVDDPYVFIKADTGTYGMGIMTAKSGADILAINKKNRNKMNIIKDGISNSSVVIQEGVPTIDTFDDKPAESMVYMVGNKVVACNYRVNENRDKFNNLNSMGMSFVDSNSLETPQNQICPVNSLIARLANIAAAIECYESNWVI